MEENQPPTTPSIPSTGSKNYLFIGMVALIILGILGAVVLFAKPRTENPATPQSGTGEVNATATDRPIDKVPKEFIVEALPFRFAPPEITVKKNDTVRITLVSKEGTHDFVLDEFNVRTKQLQAGQSETVEFIANKVGSFEFYCSVGNHRQMGMVGTLQVN